MITLKNLAQATPQQVFDQVATHLLTQMDRSADSDDTCAYRGQLGLKCAAGCLIADDEYKPYMEVRGSWGQLVNDELVPFEHEELIRQLQSVHDMNPPSNWRVHLIGAAVHHDLSTEVLEKFR